MWIGRHGSGRPDGRRKGHWLRRVTGRIETQLRQAERLLSEAEVIVELSLRM
jgi:hypothetical protein